MMKYYKDTSGKVYAFLADGTQDGFIKPGLVPITDAEADAIRNPQPTQEQIHAELVASAKSALNNTDMVCLRCYKAGVPFPADWQTYTANLRAVVNGTLTTLPTQPAYPAGT